MVDLVNGSYRKGVVRHSGLLWQLVKRDVLLRYRGAMFGVLWVFLSPLLMLAIFAFVFGQIFETRWPQRSGDAPFWLLLFAGLIVFNLFAETVSRAPTAVRSQPSYVKKIIFPVQILPLVPVGSGLIHAFFSLLVFVVALGWAGHLSPGVLLIPVLVLPVVLVAAGLSWFLSAWGVFIKDMSQIVPLLVQMMLFLSPVFYPVSAVPEFLRPIYVINPLSSVIEAVRGVLFELSVDWSAWSMTLVVSYILCLLGYAFFRHSRDEFADVL